MGGQGVWILLKNYKNIGFLSNTGPDPLKNHKATKPAFNVGMAFRWRADDDPLIVVFGSSHQPTNTVKAGPPLTNFSACAQAKVVVRLSSGASFLL